MTATDERMDRFEARLDVMGEDVKILRDDARVLKDDVKDLKEGVDGLKEEVKNLRVLVERHDTEIRLIAEVQVAHGEKLDEHGKLLREVKEQLNKDLAPLSDFVRRVASEHGARLAALEKHTGLAQEP